MLWLLLGLLLVCSGIVSASETALFGLPRQALYEFRRSPGPLRRRVYALMRSPRRVLMTVLIANTAVNVTIFTVSFFALRQIGDLSSVAAAAAGVMVPLCVIVFGEVLPKAVALSGSRRFAPPAGGLIAGLQVVFGPLQWLLAKFLVDPITRLLAPGTSVTDTVTTDELRLLVEHSAHEGIINSTENDMLQAVVALGDVSVREVMTPRVDIVSIRSDTDRTTAQETIRASGRRQLPVCGRDLDDIRGVLYARDLYLNPDATLTVLMHRVHFVPEPINLMQLLRHFRTEKIQIAVVVDEYGGTAGLVTVEDVVEWIVGELPDVERSRPAAVTERIDENSYRLWGDLSVRAWVRLWRTHAVGRIDRDIHTVAGLILAKLGRLPRPGDSVHVRNLTLTVETMRGRRIERVLLRHHHPDDVGQARHGGSVPQEDAS